MSLQWDLFRRGVLDQERHHDLVREAVRKNLRQLVTDGDIVVSQGEKKVRLPIRELREFRFRFSPHSREHLGAATPRPGQGDVIGQVPPAGPGQGAGPGTAGDGAEGGLYEVEVGLDDVAAELFADLELPNLRPKSKVPTPVPDPRMDDVRRRGPIANLDRRRTVVENIRRNARQGTPQFAGIHEDDLRFRAEKEQFTQQDRVAAVLIRDSSGSMGDERKYLSRCLAFWLLEFLRLKYRTAVETAFLLHHADAWEVDEESFFHLSEGGGTYFVPAYRNARQMIDDRFPTSQYNVYVFHFTDGDSGDARAALAALGALLPGLSLFGYVDVDGKGTFTDLLAGAAADLPPQLTIARVPSRADVVNGVRTLLQPRGVGA